MSDITDEMIEAAAKVARRYAGQGEVHARSLARDVLEAGLAGRTVVELPEPDSGSQIRFRADDNFVASPLAYSVGPRVNVSGGPILTLAQAEQRAAALLAAVRAARRLVSGSVGSETLAGGEGQ